MTPISLPNLIACAEKATPGPWQRSGVRQRIAEDCIMVGPDGFLIIAVPVGANPKDHAGAFVDAGHIANCDPATILALCRVVEAAQRYCALYHDHEAAGLGALTEALQPFKAVLT